MQDKHTLLRILCLEIALSRKFYLCLHRVMIGKASIHRNSSLLSDNDCT